jgi:DNA-binding transcriptional regulator of glucitol operon
MAFHVAMLLIVTACLALGYWQLRRGEAGNMRSYAYAVEWPFFAGAAGYMWWRSMREDISGTRTAMDQGATITERSQLPIPTDTRVHFPEPEADPELDAYNTYLAELHRSAACRR